VVQCGALCCIVLQCVAMCCSVLQCVAVCCSVLQCVAIKRCLACAESVLVYVCVREKARVGVWEMKRRRDSEGHKALCPHMYI